MSAAAQASAHTQGPWVVIEPSPGAYLQIAQAGTFASVAELRGLAPEEEQVANAHLLAAAPKLLDAAQAAWNCIAELPPTQARVECAQMLQAVIEAATGSAS